MGWPMPLLLSDPVLHWVTQPVAGYGIGARCAFFHKKVCRCLGALGGKSLVQKEAWGTLTEFMPPEGAQGELIGHDSCIT